MTCTHRTPTRWVYAEVDIGLGETEVQLVEEGGEYSTEDISIGAFRCTQCGEVGYYTGLWKAHYETGAPCPGDNHRLVNLEAVRRAAGITGVAA